MQEVNRLAEEKKKISGEVIKRLPRYYRYLGELIANQVHRISSKELSIKMGVTASQIRQDLNCFGGFGQQGYGYNVQALYRAIGEILGLYDGHKMIIIGAGYLGHALANYKSFQKRGFELIGLFDISPDVVGTTINGHQVFSMEQLDEFVSENKPDIAILAVPKAAASQVAEKLVSLGIKGMMNFCYTDIKVPEGVCVENVHLSDTLMTLSYKIAEQNASQKNTV
jgi:redox-sensing transcriptional repressor